MKKLMIFVVFFISLTSNAATLFFCKTTNGKKVKVDQTGEIVRYSFGANLSKPELTIKQKVSNVRFDTEMYSGGGASIISIPNGKYAYQLRQGIIAGNYRPNGTRQKDVFGSITVLKNDTEIAMLSCIGDSIKGE